MDKYKFSPIKRLWESKCECGGILHSSTYADWCDDCGYTRTQARKIYHGGKGEFCTFKNGEIVRLAI